MTPIPLDPLSALSDAIPCPVYRATGHMPRHILFRGSLMGFHYKLDERRVAHAVDVHPDTGMSISIPGLVVEGGGLGGVLVREAAPPIEIELSCGNVFADLGLPDAEELLRLANEQAKRMKGKGR